MRFLHSALYIFLVFGFAQFISAQPLSYSSPYSAHAENQIIQGPCYIFSAIAAIEANAKQQGLGNLDLSEWFMYSECVNENVSGGVPMMENVIDQLEGDGGLFEPDFFKPIYLADDPNCDSCSGVQCSNPDDLIIPCQFESIENYCMGPCIYGMDYSPASGTDPSYSFPITDFEEIVKIKQTSLQTIVLTQMTNEEKDSTIKNLIYQEGIGATIFFSQYSPSNSSCTANHSIYIHGWNTVNDITSWRYKDSWPCDGSSNRSKVLDMSLVTKVVLIKTTVEVLPSCWAESPNECPEIQGPTTISTQASYSITAAGASNFQWSASEGLQGGLPSKKSFLVNVLPCAPAIGWISVSFEINGQFCTETIQVNINSPSTLPSPEILVLSPNWSNNQTCPNSVLELFANYNGPLSGITYEWQIFGAAILSGQGTPTLFVQTPNNNQNTPLTFKVRVITDCGTSPWASLHGLSSPINCKGGLQYRIQAALIGHQEIQLDSAWEDQTFDYALFNAAGKSVDSGKAEGSRINIQAEMTPGIYFLQIRTASGVKTIKLFKS